MERPFLLKGFELKRIHSQLFFSSFFYQNRLRIIENVTKYSESFQPRVFSHFSRPRQIQDKHNSAKGAHFSSFILFSGKIILSHSLGESLRYSITNGKQPKVSYFSSYVCFSQPHITSSTHFDLGSIEILDFTLGNRTPYFKYVTSYDNYDDQRNIKATELNFNHPPDDLMTRGKYQAVIQLEAGLTSPEARFVIRIRLGNKGQEQLCYSYKKKKKPLTFLFTVLIKLSKFFHPLIGFKKLHIPTTIFYLNEFIMKRRQFQAARIDSLIWDAVMRLLK